MTTNYWVGVLKGKYQTHEVFTCSGDPEPTGYPQYDYVIGPYNKRIDAETRAKLETNTTGMFHPYPGDPR